MYPGMVRWDYGAFCETTRHDDTLHTGFHPGINPRKLDSKQYIIFFLLERFFLRNYLDDSIFDLTF